jgi:hypothetical protein
MKYRIYYKRFGKLTREEVDGFGKDIKKDLDAYGLGQLRALLHTDQRSPIMAVVK